MDHDWLSGMQPCGNKPSELPVVFMLIHFTHEWQRIEKTYCTQNVTDVTGTICGRIYIYIFFFKSTVSVKHFVRISGMAAFVLQADSLQGMADVIITHKYNMSVISRRKTPTELSFSCRSSKDCCVRVAPRVKSLPRRICAAEVCSWVKLHCSVGLWVGQTKNCSDPEPQACGLKWQLLHHRCNKGGRGQLQVQSRTNIQPAGGAHRVRWAATTSAVLCIVCEPKSSCWFNRD